MMLSQLLPFVVTDEIVLEKYCEISVRARRALRSGRSWRRRPGVPSGVPSWKVSLGRERDRECLEALVVAVRRCKVGCDAGGVTSRGRYWAEQRPEDVHTEREPSLGPGWVIGINRGLGITADDHGPPVLRLLRRLDERRASCDGSECADDQHEYANDCSAHRTDVSKHRVPPCTPDSATSPYDACVPALPRLRRNRSVT